MKFSDFVFEYKKIVIGCTLESLIYAYCNDLPLLYSVAKPPTYIDFFNPQHNLTHLGIDNETMFLPTASEPKAVGRLKIDLWNHLIFFLGVAGNVAMSDKTSAIRFEENNILKVATHNSRLARFRFEELIVFDDDAIVGLPNKLKPLKQGEKKYKVVDWIDIKSGMNQQIDYFKTGDDFVNEIFLYPSDRIDGNNFNLKDAVAISYLTEDQLKEFEYSDTYVRFKTLKIFKDAGFKGLSNGRCTKNPEKTKYYSLKLETRKRELFSPRRNIFEDSENIKFNCQSLEDLLQLELTEDNQPRYLCERMYKK
jgi:hypothetical protein